MNRFKLLLCAHKKKSYGPFDSSILGNEKGTYEVLFFPFDCYFSSVLTSALHKRGKRSMKYSAQKRVDTVYTEWLYLLWVID